MLIKIKCNVQSIIISNRLVLKINCQLVTFILSSTLEQILYLLFRQLDRKNPVLKAVIVENICKRRSNHATKSIVKYRPRRMFTGGAATKVNSGNQYRCTLITSFVKLKLWIYVTFCIKTPFVEQKLSKSCTFNAFQKLFWNNCVSIDIYTIDWTNNTR
ncbi:hypothetical protein D3C80_1630110 [compost metagenome]